MRIFKTPFKENDNYYFIIEKHDTLRDVDKYSKAYMMRKRIAFRLKDKGKNQFKGYLERPSFSGHNLMFDFSGSIYTYSAEKKNEMPLEDMYKIIRRHKDISRRCVIRMADSLKDYLDVKVNTSCLNIIHYYEDKVTLFFRASDMRNELLIDLHLIEEFFIAPVYLNQPYEIHVMASTAQNVIPLNTLIK